MNKKLFLIGGSGFIGKNLIETLENEFQITVFDKFIDEIFFAEHPEVTTHKIELDKDLIPEEIPSPDFIINLASIVTAERDLSLFDGMINSNLKVLLNLYERFKDDKNLKLFIQFGSSEEYGNEGAPFKEDMREHPNSPYALVKQLTTNTALMLYRNYQFPVCVIRPGNLYGKYQNPSKFIPYIIGKLKNNEILEVTPCEQRRDFIEARDFSLKIKSLLENYKKCIGEIINVSSGKSISLKELIEKYKEEFNSSSDINYGALPYREGEAMNLSCDISKFTSIIN
ncbi:MAG: NAD(P)-dependent oxidoreductase [Muribaculaceae bacterium]|nr:NAD(P)-dependent oxidoreductase [Muribaculaceae bacterium]